MKQYAWGPQYSAVVCETDDEKLGRRIEQVREKLCNRLLLLNPETEREERAVILHALEALIVTKAERIQEA